MADKLYDFKQMELDHRAQELQAAEEECRRAVVKNMPLITTESFTPAPPQPATDLVGGCPGTDAAQTTVRGAALLGGQQLGHVIASLIVEQPHCPVSFGRATHQRVAEF